MALTLDISPDPFLWAELLTQCDIIQLSFTNYHTLPPPTSQPVVDAVSKAVSSNGHLLI